MLSTACNILSCVIISPLTTSLSRSVNSTRKNSMNTTKPTIGQTITVYGQICTIVKVYPFGTIDVVTATGRQYRVTGLSF